MIFFTFWISPLSTIMLMITPCLMLTQILTLIHTLQQDCTSTLQWFNINQMKANPSKFQAISFGKRGTRDITNFTFENTTIHCENSVVLLGIEIDHSLTFNTHIANICKKAARQLAVLKRLGHLLTRQGKLAIFISFITSNFNYCPLIWHFCSQSSTKKLEKIQERALRFIYNDYSSTHHDLLKTANTEHLHVKRIKEMACEVFKIVNNIAPTFIQNLIMLKCSQYSMRKDNTAVVPKANTSKYGLWTLHILYSGNGGQSLIFLIYRPNIEVGLI